MRKTILLLGLLLTTSSSLLAQQESIITFYRDHLNLVNPAFVGVEDKASFQSSIRQQWTGIKDAPSTQAVSFMSPLRNRKLALGISFTYDKVFIEKQGFIAIDFAYQVKLSENLDLYMGIKAGGNNYEVNTNGLESYNVVVDPGLAPISRFNPNIGAGLYLKHDKYYVSLSTPRMLNTERAKNEDGFATVATDRVHYYFSGGYTFMVSPTIDIIPTFMMRYVNGAPFSTDFTATTTINDAFHIGATYRTDKSLAGFAKVRLSKKILLGYAYEYSLRSELLGRANGSNEFFIKFEF